MTGSLCASNLAAYLPFAGPDMRYVYKRQVQRSSWFTFDKIAKVKGLSNVQTRLLADVVRRPKIQRPSQVLASIRLFESVIDQALDAGWISDAEISHLEKARIRLLRTSRPWDGKNRRQFERAESPFELNVTGITKESIDEELKASYAETAEKFLQAFVGLAAEGCTESTRVQDLSAGGVALLAGDRDQFHDGDYLAFSQGEGDSPIDLSQLRGCVLETEQMEEQRQLILHVRFLPYDAELRKQVIRTVYESSERTQTEAREKGAKKAPRKKAAGAPRPQKRAPRAPEDSPE